MSNELNSTAKKITVYVLRILIAFPVLIACVPLDFTANILRATGLVIQGVLTCFRYPESYQWEQLLCDFISMIAFPIILLGSLLCGRIPQSTRPGSSLFDAYTSKGWHNRMRTNSLDLDNMAEIAMETASEGMSYTLARMLDSLDESRRKELLQTTCQIHLEYTVTQPPTEKLRGSLLLGAVYSKDLECVDIVIRAGAKLGIENAMAEETSKNLRLNLLFYACLGPIEILERIIALEGFNPHETFSISLDQLQEWFAYFSNIPPDISLDRLQNISIVELALLAGRTGALKLFQTAGTEIEYYQLAQFKHFLEHPNTNPAASLQYRQKENDWIEVTTPQIDAALDQEMEPGISPQMEKKENAAAMPSDSHSASSTCLNNNNYYKLWTALEFYRTPQGRDPPNILLKRRRNQMTPIHVHRLTEVLHMRKKIAALVSPVLNNDVASTVTSYL